MISNFFASFLDYSCSNTFTTIGAVTCVEFNPIDDNHFISGSIDGKVRIWEVERCQVVDWIDLKEIVTAVCYCPNGKVRQASLVILTSIID